jgi:hypothetical protein
MAHVTGFLLAFPFTAKSSPYNYIVNGAVAKIDVTVINNIGSIHLFCQRSYPKKTTSAALFRGYFGYIWPAMALLKNFLPVLTY